MGQKGRKDERYWARRSDMLHLLIPSTKKMFLFNWENTKIKKVKSLEIQRAQKGMASNNFTAACNFTSISQTLFGYNGNASGNCPPVLPNRLV